MPKSFSGISRRTALALGAGGAFGTVAGAGAARAQDATEEGTSMAADTHPLAPGWRRFAIGQAQIVTPDERRPLADIHIILSESAPRQKPVPARAKGGDDVPLPSRLGPGLCRVDRVMMA